jgi:hypothetical protein
MRSLLWLVSLPFRLLGTLLVVAGFAAGFWDLYLSVQRGEMVLTSLGETAAIVSPDVFGLRPPPVPAAGPATGAIATPVDGSPGAAPAEGALGTAQDRAALARDAVEAARPAIDFFLNLPSFLALLILATLFLLVAQLIYRPR